MKDTIVIIPTYNEKDNIALMIDTVMGLGEDYDLLIVDDGSPDGTAQIVKEYQTKYPQRLFLKERKGKLGLGTAYLLGFGWALEHTYRFICEMDCDFSHNPQDLIRLRQAAMAGADVAVGSRYVKGGGVQNWPKNRILLSRGGSIYARIVTGMPVKDTTAGFVCYTRAFLEALDFSKIVFKGYAFQIQMKYAAYRLGFKIVEVPILFKDREEGISKMSSNIVSEAILGTLKMRWTSIFESFGRKK